MRSWIVEYRPKCGCTALKEPVDCGQGFRVYANETGKNVTTQDLIDVVRLREKQELEDQKNQLKPHSESEQV